MKNLTNYPRTKEEAKADPVVAVNLDANDVMGGKPEAEEAPRCISCEEELEPGQSDRCVFCASYAEPVAVNLDANDAVKVLAV